MMFDSLLQDSKQQLRFTRYLGSFFSMFLFTGIAVYLYGKDFYVVETDLLVTALVTLWIGEILFGIAILSGINKLMRDPSMTQLQMMWAILFLLLLTYAVKENRGLLLMGYLAILSFGFFRLTTRQFIMNALVTVSLYLIIIIHIYINEPLRIRLDAEIMQFLVFLVTTSIMVFTGSAVSELREANRKNTRELEDALKLNMLLAITDDLTGMYTRSHFMEILSQQKARSDREGNDFIILYTDLDHFKSVNDTYGHAAGDAVLESYAEIIGRSIREVDYASRFGGEEFVICLVNTEMEQAIVVAERIREQIEKYNFNDVAPGLRVTVSIGVANYLAFNSIQETLKAADNRMYRAKQSGRNVCVYQD